MNVVELSFKSVTAHSKAQCIVENSLVATKFVFKCCCDFIIHRIDFLNGYFLLAHLVA